MAQPDTAGLEPDLFMQILEQLMGRRLGGEAGKRINLRSRPGIRRQPAQSNRNFKNIPSIFGGGVQGFPLPAVSGRSAQPEGTGPVAPANITGEGLDPLERKSPFETLRGQGVRGIGGFL